MYHKFTSDISRFGPILTPYILEIDDNFITYSKRNKNLFNKNSMSMAIDNIAAVKIDTSLLGTTLTISSFGGEDIIIRKMNITDAKKANEIIKNLRKKS